MAGVLVAVAVAGSLISCCRQQMCTHTAHGKYMRSSIFRTSMGCRCGILCECHQKPDRIGSLMAFPGSMVGALCCGLMYRFSKKIIPTCVAEALGTGILGGLGSVSSCKICDAHSAGRHVYIHSAIPYLYSGRKHSCSNCHADS